MSELQHMLEVTADRRTELSNLRKGDSTYTGVGLGQYTGVGMGTFDLFSILSLTVSKINVTDRPNK